jgi:hypothetical protein
MEMVSCLRIALRQMPPGLRLLILEGAARRVSLRLSVTVLLPVELEPKQPA